MEIMVPRGCNPSDFDDPLTSLPCEASISPGSKLCTTAMNPMRNLRQLETAAMDD